MNFEAAGDGSNCKLPIQSMAEVLRAIFQTYALLRASHPFLCGGLPVYQHRKAFTYFEDAECIREDRVLPAIDGRQSLACELDIAHVPSAMVVVGRC
jgi:hypothetical protein